MSNLKKTLKTLTRAMSTSQQLIRVVNGKVVYLFKVADQLNTLDRCFSSEEGFLCPTNVLKTVTSLQWLGFAWNPELKLSFPTSGTILTNTGKLDITPLAIYNFPCNVSFTGMKTSLATCPKARSVSLPVFSEDSIVYVKWDPTKSDMGTLQLHHESLSIPPRVVLNRSVINDFDEMFNYYDSQLSSTLEKADDMINQIEVTTETTLTDYIAYVALGLSVINFILCCVACQCIKIFQRRFQKVPERQIRLQTVTVTPHQHKICKRCDKPKPISQENQNQSVRQGHHRGKKRS
ncbi:hypothetical protein ACROYT_G040703 [Oculina patagonica]